MMDDSQMHAVTDKLRCSASSELDEFAQQLAAQQEANGQTKGSIIVIGTLGHGKSTVLNNLSDAQGIF